MRELMIRFVDDGEVYREIDESRNYYLSEAEDIIEKIKIRLKNEKRVALPKGFEFWLDGIQLIISHADFESGQLLSKQIEETIMNYEEWEENIRHKHINSIHYYLAQERDLLIHKPFQAFAVRFDQVLGSEKVKPFPCLIKLIQLKELFDSIFIYVEANFYSELESIIESISMAYQTVVKLVHNELIKVESPDYEQFFDFLKVRITTWLGEKENFLRFKNYVVACYQSVPRTRIYALYPRFEPYQNLQKYLFIDYVDQCGFDEAYELNRQLVEGFTKKYNDVLFEGFILKSDEMIQSLVLSPVIKLIKDTAESLLSEGGENEGTLNNQKATV